MTLTAVAIDGGIGTGIGVTRLVCLISANSIEDTKGVQDQISFASGDHEIRQLELAGRITRFRRTFELKDDEAKQNVIFISKRVCSAMGIGKPEHQEGDSELNWQELLQESLEMAWAAIVGPECGARVFRQWLKKLEGRLADGLRAVGDRSRSKLSIGAVSPSLELEALAKFLLAASYSARHFKVAEADSAGRRAFLYLGAAVQKGQQPERLARVYEVYSKPQWSNWTWEKYLEDIHKLNESVGKNAVSGSGGDLDPNPTLTSSLLMIQFLGEVLDDLADSELNESQRQFIAEDSAERARSLFAGSVAAPEQLWSKLRNRLSVNLTRLDIPDIRLFMCDSQLLLLNCFHKADFRTYKEAAVRGALQLSVNRLTQVKRIKHDSIGQASTATSELITFIQKQDLGRPGHSR